MSSAADSEIKLTDFGLCAFLEDPGARSLLEACGTPGYVAPEVLFRRPYGTPVDLWALGTIMYSLLCGYAPFTDSNDVRARRGAMGAAVTLRAEWDTDGTLTRAQAGTFRRTKAGAFAFNSPEWDPVSSHAKDLIRALLHPDPERRANPEAVLSHRWLLALEGPSHTPGSSSSISGGGSGGGGGGGGDLARLTSELGSVRAELVAERGALDTARAELAVSRAEAAALRQRESELATALAAAQTPPPPPPRAPSDATAAPSCPRCTAEVGAWRRVCVCVCVC